MANIREKSEEGEHLNEGPGLKIAMGKGLLQQHRDQNSGKCNVQRGGTT